jgi:hypothetical protein
LKEEGQQERLVGQEKGGEGQAFKGKRFRRKKLDPEKPKEVGRAKQTEAWIPTLPKEQPDTKAREARSQPG